MIARIHHRTFPASTLDAGRLLTLAAAATLAAWVLPPAAGAQEVALPLGTQAPPASLEDLDGNPVQILDLVEEGKPTLLEFWASWCHDCEELQPEIDRVHERHGEEINIVVVAVAVSQSPRRVKRHVEDHQSAYPYLWDGEGAAVRAYKVPGTSVVLILDRNGRVAYSGTGGSQDLMGAVERILGAGAPGS